VSAETRQSQTNETTLERVATLIRSRRIRAEIIDCGQPTLTVAEAAEAVNSDPSHIIKTLLSHDGKGAFVIAIAAGHSRIDKSKLLGASGLHAAKLASPEVVLEQLGYPAGGVAPIDLPASIPVIVDHAAASLDVCYAGAGSTSHLVRIDPRDIIELNGATVADIVETS
jgi:prolyl-tRNA editing enzyme YbaK/EbsC (Cys-tRNA(Pro) deacylase)